MKTKPHICTEEEIAYIKRNYKGNKRSLSLIAQELNLNPNCIKWQIQKLGITVKHVRWTDKEKDTLQELSGRYCAWKVAKLMSRSINSVVVMRKVLGITRIGRDGWYCMNEACEILGVDHKTLRRWIDDRTLIASRYNGENKSNTYWQIKEKNIRNFITNYTQELVGRNIDIIQVVQIVNKHNPNGFKRRGEKI